MKDRLATLIETLVTFPSIEGRPWEKKNVIDFASGWFRKHDVDVTHYPHAENPSIVASVSGRGKPVLFLAHLDVVPATDVMFHMRRKGDIITGRGVLDDKGPAAILMTLLANVAQWQDRPSVMLALTTDEEIGSEDGLERLVKMGIFHDARAVIALDGGGETNVVFREKGLVHFALEATGRSAHNSTPWAGENAIEKLFRCYEKLKTLFPATDDPLYWHPTVSIGTISGGEFVNQVPPFATAQIDLRFTDTHSLQEVMLTIEEALEPGVTIAHSSGGHPFETKRDDPLLQAYVETMQESVGKEISVTSEHGATDARFFRAMGIPVWLHEPKGGGMHTEEEWMDLESAEKLLRGMERFLRTLPS